MGPTTIREIERRLTSPAFAQDPHPVYRELQESAPVYWSEAIGMWLVTRYDDVRLAQHAPATFSNFGWEESFIQRLPADVLASVPEIRRQYSAPTIVFSDPPEHTRLRRLVSRAFVPRAIEPLRGWLRGMCDDLIERSETDTFDVIGELAFPLPLAAISRLFGGAPEDEELYLRLSQAKVAFLGTPQPIVEHAHAFERMLVAFQARLDVLLDRLRAHPDDGLLSALVHGDGDGERLTDEEIRRMCLIFLSAGHETTTSLIGNVMLALATHPEELEHARRDHARVPQLIEEALRWESPVQRSRRIVREDIEFAGVQLRRGDEVALALGAANRDPTRFERPELFDPLRTAIPHLALGHGIHFCVGAGLTRLEATMAVTSLLDHLPQFAPADGWQPSWVSSTNLRCLEELPLARS